MKQAVAKIAELRKMAPHLHISVDEGVNDKNTAELIATGANFLVAGGRVFKAHDKKSATGRLKGCHSAGVLPRPKAASGADLLL